MSRIAAKPKWCLHFALNLGERCGFRRGSLVSRRNNPQSIWEETVRIWNKARLALGLVPLSGLVVGCATTDPFGREVELQAQAQADLNGVPAQLHGQFRIEAEGVRLTGELDNSNFPSGKAISFCLSKPTVRIPLAAPDTNAQGVAQFELNTQSGQTVPTVNVGDKIEARQGATTAGSADCTAPLLISATFQADINQSDH